MYGSSSSCDGVARVCTVNVATYGMHYVQYLQQAAAAVVLPFYAARLWVIASPYTYTPRGFIN